MADAVMKLSAVCASVCVFGVVATPVTGPNPTLAPFTFDASRDVKTRRSVMAERPPDAP